MEILNYEITKLNFESSNAERFVLYYTSLSASPCVELKLLGYPDKDSYLRKSDDDFYKMAERGFKFLLELKSKDKLPLNHVILKLILENDK